MTQDLFRIYRSSAGSGKTYHLTMEYLLLALQSPEYFRRILAVTFTNKATNEMKARIISNLYSIKSGIAGDDLVDKLSRELNVDHFVLQQKASNTLKSILHEYSYFAVSTIDSFFQRVVTAFARDMGIQGGFSIEFEQNKVTDEIIDRLFLDLEEDLLLRNWLTRFTESRIEENKDWDIRNEIRELTAQIYYEKFHDYLPVFGDRIADKDLLVSLLNRLKTERAVYKTKLSEYGREGLLIIKSAGLEISDFSYGIKGPAGFLYKVAEDLDYDLNTYVLRAYEDKDAWFTKKSKDKPGILNVLEDGLFGLYREIIDYYRKHIRRQTTLFIVLKLFYNIGIYSNLIEKLVEYRKENAIILISDLARLIRTIIGENDAPFIYEKIGNYYHHFLIDEFQDTSGFQWNNFKPLIKNSIAQGKFNMLVGDVKQSIYRWRGGDWQILQESVVEDIGKEYIKTKFLNNNWRSRENVVSFNNEVFQHIPELLSRRYLDQIPADTDPEYRQTLESYSLRFRESYSDVKQHIPSKRTQKKGGEISVKFFGNEDNKNNKDPVKWRDKVLEDLIPLIKRIQDKHYQAKEIAILVRSNREGKIVSDHLLEYKSSGEGQTNYIFDVISSESLFLYTSAAVNAVINFMKLIRDSSDKIARINMYYWLSVLKGSPEGITLSELFQKSLDPNEELILNQYLLNKKESLRFTQYRTLALDDMVEIISLELDLEKFPQEQAYLLGLQNVILDFLNNYNGDLNSFLDWWEIDGKNKSINPSEEQNAIQILTIHKAKGLEFEQVIIPFCSWNLDNRPNSTILWCSSEIDLLKDLPFYPVKYEQEMKDSYFINDYFSEKSLAYMDNVNLLYVALTRAVSGLYIYSELPEKPTINNVGNLLFRIFDDSFRSDPDSKTPLTLASFWDNENKSYHHGEIPSDKGEKADENMFKLDLFPKDRWYEKIAIRKQPDILSAADRGEPVNYGILMHDILSKIIRKEQVSGILQDEMRNGRITHEAKRRIENMLVHLWENRKIEDWFTGDWKIKTEVPVLPGSGQISRMDRLMIKGDHVIVVDYKTGFPASQDRKQVMEYKKILRDMGYSNVEGFLVYLADGQLQSV